MAETNGISDNLDSTLSIAYRNICNAKTPIKTLKDLSQIKWGLLNPFSGCENAILLLKTSLCLRRARGVGKWILRLMQGFFQESVAEEPSANNDAAWNSNHFSPNIFFSWKKVFRGRSD